MNWLRNIMSRTSTFRLAVLVVSFPIMCLALGYFVVYVSPIVQLSSWMQSVLFIYFFGLLFCIIDFNLLQIERSLNVREYVSRRKTKFFGGVLTTLLILGSCVWFLVCIIK